MKTIFDKIYVLSLITNHSRQEFIQQQFDELGIEFEFIYGIDFKNIKCDHNGEIQYPDVWSDADNLETTPGDFGCTMAHYQAVLQAYEFGYNNVLIIEDDICFIKNPKLIEYYLNNVPEDADYVSWDPRFVSDFERTEFHKELFENQFNDWIVVDNIKYQTTIGGMLYGIMNRETMELYLNNQRALLCMSDHVQGIYENCVVKKYISTKCLCADQYNINNDFVATSDCYSNIYRIIENLSPNQFFVPDEFLEFTR